MNKIVEQPVVDEPIVDAQVTETDDAQAQADFDAGVAMEQTGTKPAPARDDNGRFVAGEEPAPAAAKPDNKDAAAAKLPAKPAAKTDVKPEYVQVTKAQFEKLETAAGKTEEYEKQFSKVFGTVGDMQKILRNLQSQTPRGAAVKLPPGAFDAMKKDFPELAEHMQTAMGEILKGFEGTGAAASDPAEFEKQLEARVLKMVDEDLVDEFPEWKKIVGTVNLSKGEKADPNNPFRKWLATRPQEYQDRLNNTTSAGVITRAIRLFKADEKAAKAAATAAPAKPNEKDAARARRIADAVRPRSDGGHPPGSAKEDEFESGFKTG